MAHEDMVSRDVQEIPRYAGKDPDSQRYAASISDYMERVLRDHYQDLLNLFTGASGSSGGLRRAVIKTVGSASFTVKLLDSFNNEEFGNEITVYPHQHYGTNPLAGDILFKPAAGKKVAIFKDINGVWYTAFPLDDKDDGTPVVGGAGVKLANIKDVMASHFQVLFLDENGDEVGTTTTDVYALDALTTTKLDEIYPTYQNASDEPEPIFGKTIPVFQGDDEKWYTPIKIRGVIRLALVQQTGQTAEAEGPVEDGSGINSKFINLNLDEVGDEIFIEPRTTTGSVGWSKCDPGQELKGAYIPAYVDVDDKWYTTIPFSSPYGKVYEAEVTQVSGGLETENPLGGSDISVEAIVLGSGNIEDQWPGSLLLGKHIPVYQDSAGAWRTSVVFDDKDDCAETA